LANKTVIARVESIKLLTSDFLESCGSLSQFPIGQNARFVPACRRPCLMLS